MTPERRPEKYLCKLLLLSVPFFMLPAHVSIAAEEPAFSFLAPPHKELTRLFWLNNKNGQMGVCQYALSEEKGKLGTTNCFPSGDGAGPIGSGRYALKASNYGKENGVFRVNIDTGDISNCWLRNGKVVCTTPAK